MKRLFPILVAAALLSGCVSATGTSLGGKLVSALLAYVPDGTTKDLHINVNSPWGFLTIDGTNVTKSPQQITSEKLDVVISSPVSPVFHFHSEGYAPSPGTPVVPTTLKLR